MVEPRLDLQFFAGEKTEKATPKKRQDSRKKGQVAKSQDINTAVNLIAVFAVLAIMGSYMYEQIIGLMIEFFQNKMLEQITEENLASDAFEVLKIMGLTLAPVFVQLLWRGCYRILCKSALCFQQNLFNLSWINWILSRALNEFFH